MKSKRPVFKSFRKKILYKPKGDVLQPNIRHGETLIPTGGTPTVISLPKTVNTFTYDIINTDRLSSDLTLATTEGTLKGLILNTDQGNLSIDPVALGTRQLQFASTIKDGSYISTLSDGADWFIWSFGIGQGLAQSTNKRPANTPPSSGFIGSSIGGNLNSIVQSVQYTSVSIDNSDVTVDFPGGSAEHDISIDGSAHPSTASLPVIIKVFTPGDIFVTDINVATDGSWNFSAENLGNGNHEFIFKQFIGGTQVNSAVSWNRLLDGGSLEFDCPTIEIEVGTNSPDFTVFPTVQHVDLSGVVTPIPVSVKSTTYTSSKAEDDTFNVVFEYDFDGVTYEQTIDGVVVNLVQPAEPTISTVGGNASNVAISTPIADIVGTANPNATVQVWIDGIPNTPIGTVTADGIGEWTISSHDFGFTMNQTVIIKAQQQTAGGSLWSNSSTDFLVRYEQNVLSEPTITSLVADLTTFSTGDYSNKSNPFTINGTGIAGSEITLNGATALGGTITVAGDGTWTTTTNLSHDATHDITAQATKAGFTQSQQSTAFQLNVDRTAPTFGTINDITLFLGNVTDSLPTANDSFDPNGVTVTPSYSPSLASVEGDYVATYTATDRAGNSTTATGARTITVTTEPIVPVITSITANSDGTFTVAGTVTGTYADNLTVQVTIGGSDSGSPVSVLGEAFTHITSAQSPGTYEFKAKSINTAAQESAPSSAETAAIAAPDTTAPEIVIRNNADNSVITNQTVTITEGDTFSFTATATDNVDGDISGNIVQGGHTLDTTTAGTYNLTFSVSDSASPTPNTDSATLAVEVVAASSFLEDLKGVGPIFNDNSSLVNAGLRVDLDTDGIISYDSAGNPVNQEFTISFWAELSGQQVRNSVGFMGANDWNTGGGTRRFKVDLSGGSTLTNALIGVNFGPALGTVNNNNDSFNLANTYTHFAFVAKSNGVKLKFRIYVDGNQLTNVGTFDLGTKLFPKSNNEAFTFGGRGSQPFSVKGNFDSIQIADGVALEAAQVQAIANHTDRNMTIATAAALDTTAPVMTITNTDTGLDLIDGDTVSILDGGTFNFTATADDGSPVVVAQGGSPVTSGVTTFAAGTYSVTFDSTDGTNAASTITINLEVVATGVFLEELSSAVSNLASGAVISSGIFDKGSATGTTHINMESDGIIQFSGVNPVNTDFTLSFWFRPDDNFGNGFNYVMGKYASSSEPNSEFRIAMAKHPSGFIQFKPYIGGMGQNTPSAVGFNSFAIGNWYHVAMTYKYNSSSSKYEFRTYLDGVPGENKLDLTYSILNTFKASREFGIGRTRNGGGGSFIGNSPACSLDSIQFGDGIVLDDYQIQQIYNQSNRLMSIAEAQALTDPSPGSNSPTTFIEDNDDVISRNPGKINTSTGEYRDLVAAGNNSGLQVLLDTDGVIQYSAGQPLNDEFTISWWMKPDAVQAKNKIGVLGYSVSNNRMLTLRINNGTSGLTSPKYELKGGTPNQGIQSATYNGANNGNIGDGNWHHFAIQCTSNGTALITKLFVDGNDLGIGSNFLNRNTFVPAGFKLLPPSSNESFYFGSAPDLNSSGNNGSITAQFDSMQMGVVLTNSQIAAIAAQSDRQMSIATASGLP